MSDSKLEETLAVQAPDDTSEILSVLSTDEERIIAARILPGLTAKANVAAEATKTRELKRYQDALSAQNQVLIEAELEKFRKSNTPPTQEELQTLLNQEYISFTVNLRTGVNTRRSFTITELPQAAEKQAMKVLRDRLLPHLRETNSMNWTTGSVAENMQRLIELIPEAIDILAELCVIALDPFGETASSDEPITLAWVQKNFGSTRIITIVDAQVQAMRLRDFISAVSRFIPKVGTAI